MSSSTSSNNFFFIRFGEFTTQLITFNDQISLNEIEEYIHNRFSLFLPSTNHIEFYSWKAKKFLVLNEDLLRSDYNPFLVNIPTNENIIESVQVYIELSVVDDSNIGLTPNLPSNISCNSIADQHDAASSTQQFDQVHLDEVENVSNINISTSVFEKDNDDYLLERTTQEVYPPSDYLNSNRISNEDHYQATHTDTQNKQFTPLYFSHDVKKHQKDNYLSNVFSVDQQVDQNSVADKTIKGIGFLQGRKEPNEEMLHIVPKIQGIQQFQKEPDAELYIFGVHEEVKDNVRIWSIHRDKKFVLSNKLKPGAELYNPIKFNLNEITLNKNGDFELNMYMLTKWGKLEKEIELHRMDEAKTLQLHPAFHQPPVSRTHIPPVRLLCVVKCAGMFYWNTFCLSDFIQPPLKLPKNNLSVTTAQTDEPKRKKSKKT